MTKGKDNSEQVRIRTEYAEYIRGESARLGKNFLSTLYWMIDNYRDQRSGNAQIAPTRVMQISQDNQDTTSQTVKPAEISNEDLLDNLGDFE